jgi:hypothetical protein
MDRRSWRLLLVKNVEKNSLWQFQKSVFPEHENIFEILIGKKTFYRKWSEAFLLLSA